MKTIIKIEPEWNGAHAYLENVDYDLQGWAVLPELFKSVWISSRPFVNLTVNTAGEIADMVKGAESYPDLGATKNEKLSELSRACNETIVSGCDVTLSSGSGHIALTSEDQINLANAASSIASGATEYPYHLDGKLCAMYSAADIQTMARAATAHKLYHTTYYNHLSAWVKRCDTSDTVQGITYGSALPTDLANNMNTILAAMSHA